MVDDESEDDHNITFLYTLGPGTCPKSFGINVARLASLPPQVLTNAKLVSEEFEQEMNDRHNQFVVSPENALEYKEKIMKAIEAGDWQLLKQLQVELKGSANLDSS
jgi:DNA mismatch repair protein MSH6